MITTTVVIASLVAFAAAYRLYGTFLERRFGIDPHAPTPAVSQEDRVDYVPSRLPVLMGHHFASIAGAGPTPKIKT